jgi:hypothetical protein
MLICVCLRILASSRIPRYDLGRQNPSFLRWFCHTMIKVVAHKSEEASVGSGRISHFIEKRDMRHMDVSPFIMCRPAPFQCLVSPRLLSLMFTNFQTHNLLLVRRPLMDWAPHGPSTPRIACPLTLVCGV